MPEEYSLNKLARNAQGSIAGIESLVRPFSNFKFLDSHTIFSHVGHSLRRIFSEARRAGALTLAIETIEKSGETEDETHELQRLFPSYTHSKLFRLTFWSTLWHPKYGKDRLFHPEENSLLGYLIIRSDYFADNPDHQVHIFESVFRKYDHFHNFIPCSAKFRIRFCDCVYPLTGVMYCQQNAMTKACAQVALRSLLTSQFQDRPILYSTINHEAGQSEPHRGLNSSQIRRVLDYYGVNYRDLDYTAGSIQPDDFPYGNLLYAGLENGCGGLLGFDLAGIDNTGDAISPGKHLIPFFGHTFLQDAWTPRAQSAYFRIGKETKYIPSHEWLGSFIGHDDNFGSNFCVPKEFLDPDKVSYVVALLPNGYKSDPVQAEIAAAHVLYTIFALTPQNHQNAFWFKKLSDYVTAQDVVLRTREISGQEYSKHIGNMQDWDGNSSGLPEEFFRDYLPNKLWMVELSIPEVFATNFGKLGEILIPGDEDLVLDDNPSEEELQNAYLSKVIFVRLPGVALILINKKQENELSSIVPLRCGIRGHTPLYNCPSYQ